MVTRTRHSTPIESQLSSASDCLERKWNNLGVFFILLLELNGDFIV